MDAPNGLVPLERKMERRCAHATRALESSQTTNNMNPLLYTGRNIAPKCRLEYDWTGWLSEHSAAPGSLDELVASCAPLWKTDHLVLQASHFENGMIQLLFKSGPDVSPVVCASRAKGRLLHAFRAASVPATFSRKLSLRSLGANTRTDVEQYIARQAQRADLADPRFASQLEELAVINTSVSLAEPIETARGRYWYNLHIVLVTQGRFRCTSDADLRAIRDNCLEALAALKCCATALSVMPDHLHAALRGNIDLSPAEIAVSIQNLTSQKGGLGRVWQDEFYVGTFSEYSTEAME